MEREWPRIGAITKARIRFIREIRGSNSFHADGRGCASLPQMGADAEGIYTVCQKSVRKK
jgi:hypothetical protein